jgi:TRAP-type C4-dicarboxylate transport system permease small subunit
MIGTLIGIIILLIIVGVIWWAIQQLLPLIPLPEPFRRIIYVLMVVVLVLIVLYVILQLLGAVTPIPTWLHYR